MRVKGDGGTSMITPDVVGREDELGRLKSFLDRIPAGPRVFVIRGEQGMGKTSLWRVGAKAAREQDIHVLGTRATAEEIPRALSGLEDMVASLEGSEALFESDIDPGLRGRILLQILREATEAGPVVLAIDDLQWLDLGTTRTLRYALHRLESEPVGILTTLRTEAGDVDPIGLNRMFPAQWYDQVDLGPLEPDEMRSVLAAVTSTLSRPTLNRIMETSGGNPLYALELTRVVRDQSVGRFETIPLPDTLAEAIQQNLDGVAEELTSLLTMMSVLGPTTVGILEKLLDGEDVSNLLELGRESGVLVIEDDLKVRFAHPLIGSAVYEGTSPLLRRSLHELVTVKASAPDVVARHLAMSVTEPDESVARRLEEAASVAAQKGAYDLAADLVGHSRRLTPEENCDAQTSRALTEAMHRAAAGEAGRAIASLDELIAELPPGPSRASVVSRRFYLDVDGALPLLEEALESAGVDHQMRGRVLELMGWRYTFWGDLDKAKSSLEDAIQMGRLSRSHNLEATASASLAMVHEQMGKPVPELMTIAEGGEGAADSTHLIRSTGTLRGRQSLWAGTVEAARGFFELARREVAQAGIEYQRPYRLYDLALVEVMAGNIDLAGEYVSDAMAAATDADNDDAIAWLHHPLSMVEAWMGRVESARRAAEWRRRWAVAREEAPGVARSLCVLGLIDLSLGRFSNAADFLEEAAQILEKKGIGHPGAYPALPDGVEAMAHADRLPEASSMLERLDLQAELVDRPWVWAARDRAHGVILSARGDVGRAVSKLQGAHDRFAQLGCAPDAARCLLLMGEALRRSGDRRAAFAVLEDARAKFSDMGARQWVARTSKELERVAPGSTETELTTTESQIAGLVAQGMKNREIASALFVSIATVEAHLTRIYRRLGIRSRSELTRLVADGSIDVTTPSEHA